MVGRYRRALNALENAVTRGFFCLVYIYCGWTIHRIKESLMWIQRPVKFCRMNSNVPCSYVLLIKNVSIAAHGQSTFWDCVSYGVSVIAPSVAAVILPLRCIRLKSKRGCIRLIAGPPPEAPRPPSRPMQQLISYGPSEQCSCIAAFMLAVTIITFFKFWS